MKTAVLLALTAGVAANPVTNNPTLTGSGKCSIVNIAMDESGSMKREQKFIKEYGIPRLSTLLLGNEYQYDHVFFCTNGFGNLNSPLPYYFRHIGCSEGVNTTNSGLMDSSITNFLSTDGGDDEDGYQAILESIAAVPSVISGVNIASSCGTLRNNFILVTDEDRDDLTNNATGVAEVRAAIADNNYILNEVVNILIQIDGNLISPADSEIGIRANYDPTLLDNPTLVEQCLTIPPIPVPVCSNVTVYDAAVVNEFFTTNVASGVLGDWKTETTNDPPDQYITNGEGSSFQHYFPLIQNTRGAMWSIEPLRSSFDPNSLAVTDQNTVEAWAENFVDIKVDEIDCPAPPCHDTEIGGDPHITTWRNEHYEYHGQCDLVMLKDDKFADGLGIDVHIRTKLVRYWSYIKSVAIRIGNDILEIEGSGDVTDQEPHYWINYEYQADIEEFAGFPVTLNSQAAYKRFWTIDLGPKYKNEYIEITIYKEFLRVRFSGGKDSFGTSVGLMGDYYSGKTLARDGHTVIDDFTELGHEWQVLPSEPKLFRTVEPPQFPKKCLEPENPRGERRRRLEQSSITMEEAEDACKSLKDPLTRKDCVYDILATQDIDMVGAF